MKEEQNSISQNNPHNKQILTNEFLISLKSKEIMEIENIKLPYNLAIRGKNSRFKINKISLDKRITCETHHERIIKVLQF